MTWSKRWNGESASRVSACCTRAVASRVNGTRRARRIMALMPVAEALRLALADAKPLPAEVVALDHAAGRVLTLDVAALRTQPPTAVSAMDGYAVRASDVATAPAVLKVVGEIAAGHPFVGEVAAGQAT